MSDFDKAKKCFDETIECFADEIELDPNYIKVLANREQAIKRKNNREN